MPFDVLFQFMFSFAVFYFVFKLKPLNVLTTVYFALLFGLGVTMFMAATVSLIKFVNT